MVVTVPIGALVAGITMEYFGRLNTIKLAAIPCAIGWIMLATGQNFSVLLIARLLIGASSGNNEFDISGTDTLKQRHCRCYLNFKKNVFPCLLCYVFTCST